MVPATRPIICLTDDSRSSEPIRPRKYFCATMFVAFCDHVAGNSTPSCLKPPTSAVRISHSTVEEGSTPGLVKRRSTRRPRPSVVLFCATLPTFGMTLFLPLPASLTVAREGVASGSASFARGSDGTVPGVARKHPDHALNSIAHAGFSPTSRPLLACFPRLFAELARRRCTRGRQRPGEPAVSGLETAPSAASPEPLEELRGEVGRALAGLHRGGAKRREPGARPGAERPHQGEREHEDRGNRQRDDRSERHTARTP